MPGPCRRGAAPRERGTCDRGRVGVASASRGRCRVRWGPLLPFAGQRRLRHRRVRPRPGLVTADSDRPARPRQGTAIVTGTATQDLPSLSLDLTRANTTIERVTVDGAAVEPGWMSDGRKLRLSLPRPIAEGSSSRSRSSIRHDRIRWPRPARTARSCPSAPTPARPPTRQGAGTGVLADGADGFLLAAQPNGAHTLFPSNDYPTDKADLTVRLTAPAGMLGVATGQLASVTPNDDGSTTSVWQSRHPVATHVLEMAVGRYELLAGTGPGGLPLRSAVPHRRAHRPGPLLDRVPGYLAWLEDTLGPFPFESVSALRLPDRQHQRHARRADARAHQRREPHALPAGVPVGRCAGPRTSHQWFGDSVSLERWDEKWLSEGHATFYRGAGSRRRPVTA